ncbi:MAG: Npun_F0494 family protein [Vulcanococcus sp.]
MIATPATSRHQHALRRARQAVRCLPFRLGFYRELEQGALSSSQVASRSDWPQLSHQRLNATGTEDALIWLIQLGVLRREVDGQGLTERVRLTPLGREVLEPWDNGIPAAGPLLRLRHWLRRHRPRL